MACARWRCSTASRPRHGGAAARACRAAGRIDAGLARDLIDALHFLMGLKLASNLRQIAAGRAPDNVVRLPSSARSSARR